MTYGRRKTDRRRRVHYTTHHADNSPATPASRRAAERLREARRPTAAYGVRVQRRLRGRWFTLVPIRRRTLITVAVVLSAISLLLCVAHYAAVAWPSIAYRPEIARPLRLDRPDSFGRWITSALLAGSAAASLLIYQLRRYRIDDYQGRYRVWRLVIIVLISASVNSLASLIDWGGAILDAGMGRRVALSGNDWIRLFVTLGGIILALRLIAEVRRSRWALITMIAACTLLAIPEAAKWKFIKVESIEAWAFVTSAPLLAFTALFLSLGGYLRMLYREVRQIDDGESLAERVQRFRVRMFQRADSERAGSERSGSERAGGERAGEKMPNRKPSTHRIDAPEIADNEPDETDAPRKASKDAPPRSGRRWLGLRSAKPDDVTADRDDREADRPESAKPPNRRRRFSMRLAPAVEAESAPQEKSNRGRPPGSAAKPGRKSKEPPAVEESQAEGESQTAKDSQPQPKKGLGAWFRSRKPADPEAEQPVKEKPPEGKASPAPNPAPRVEIDDDDIPSGDIDWDSMSKSERRRLRKKLRRNGRAA